MRLRQLSLIRYGKFTDRLLEFPQAAQDIHLIVGPNEAGKSTSRAAIGDLLFGIPTRTPLAFLHPMPEMRLGGVLEQGDERLAFERSKGSKQTLRTPADAVLPDGALQPWLGDASRGFFEQAHALDHAALVRGGDGILSAADDLGRLLFQSAAGIDQLGKVLGALEEEEGALWAPRRSGKREYYLALEAFEQAGASLKHAVARSKDWKEQYEAVREAEQALEAVQARQQDVRRRRAQLERIRRVLPALRALETAQAGLDALGDAALLPEDAAAVLNQGVTDKALAQADQERHAQALLAAEQALAALRLQPDLLALAPDIQALGEDRLQCRGHRDEIARRQQELATVWQTTRAAAAQLGWDEGIEEDALRERLPTPAARALLERLSQQQGGLLQQRDAARRSLLAKQEELLHAEATLAALPAAGVRPALQVALDRARKLGDHEGLLDELQGRQAQMRAALQRALERLGRWSMEPAALRRMVVPDHALLQQLLAEQRRDAAALQAGEAQVAARRDECEQAQRELDQLIATWQPVSREQVLAARERRDAGWREIRAEPAQLEARAAGFEQSMQQADTLADARLDRIHHEAERQTCAQRLDSLRLRLTQEGARADAVRQGIATAQQHWQDLTLACGLPSLPLDVAGDWLAARQQALDAEDALDEAGRQCAARVQLGDDARLALVEALGGASAPSLAHALKLAEAELELASRTQGQRSSLAAQAADAGRAVLALQRAEAEAARQWQAWQDDWAAACAAAGFAPEQGVEQLRSDLAVMAGIGANLDKIRQLREERIAVMRTQLDQLAAGARELASRGAPELLQGPGLEPGSDELVLALQARGEAAKQAHVQSQQLQAAVTAARAGIAAATARLDGVAARLSLLVSLAGGEDRETLAAAVERSERRRRLAREREALVRQLGAEGDGLGVDALRAEAEATDAGELALQWEAVQQEEDRLLHEAQALGAAHQKAGALLAAFDGSDRAARAETERQEAIERMVQAAQGYIRARAASRLLKWSIEQYRQTRQGPMLRQASGIFAGLTLGSFSRLVVDFEGAGGDGRPRLQGLRPDGRSVGVEGMSEGSRDQLYLALRLAAMHMQADGQARPMPFIADDLFINFDDRRAAAGLQALGELSRKTQVLFLTHHEHLVAVARDVLGAGLNVVSLSS